ncbi:Chaperonin-like RbcX protein [Dioscorea alata]|uniref:Chaperonin-like RbcX protein n=1 Tax=Dioscorea alata TaxID=55571 RepID=A0ACB7U0F8_DIOAL|nr:Chaperonin-like RbcX protein [Dioscorea alata]
MKPNPLHLKQKTEGQFTEVHHSVPANHREMAGVWPIISAMDTHCCPCLSFRNPKPFKRSLESSFATHPWRSSCLKRTPRKKRRLVIANEIAGQYEEGFDDVHQQLINYFTQKAVRTVLYQLYEMNPPKYMWFYNFVASNDTTESKHFLRTLAKKCDHAKMYQRISDENLGLMRERLIETVIWPSEDANSDT